MGDLDRRVLSLLELLHAAPGRPPVWLEFLAALRAAISPDAFVCFAAQPNQGRPGVLAAPGLGLIVAQLDALLTPSRRHPSAAELPVGSVIELPAGALARQPLFRDVLAPAGAKPGAGFAVVNERNEDLILAATLVLPRSAAWRPGAADRALLERLAPHLALARRLHVKLIEGQHDIEALLSAFEPLVLGVVLLSSEGRVTYVNPSAADSLGLAPGFDDPSRAEPGALDARTHAWRRLLGSEREWTSDGFVLAHPEDGRPLQLVSTPFRANDGIGRRFARAVFVGDLKRRSGDPLGILAERFGLTPGETRLALLLASDCSLDEAARLLGISRNTSQSVLKRVFAKMGVRRQSELVRLILMGFARVRREPSDVAARSGASPR